MEEIYEIIEQKIREAGYPRQVSGEQVYEDICDQIEEQEDGTYLLLSKFEEDVVFEYHITIMGEQFNLEQIHIQSPEGEWTVEFDS